MMQAESSKVGRSAGLPIVLDSPRVRAGRIEKKRASSYRSIGKTRAIDIGQSFRANSASGNARVQYGNVYVQGDYHSVALDDLRTVTALDKCSSKECAELISRLRFLTTQCTTTLQSKHGMEVAEPSSAEEKLMALLYWLRDTKTLPQQISENLPVFKDAFGSATFIDTRYVPSWNAFESLLCNSIRERPGRHGLQRVKSLRYRLHDSSRKDIIIDPRRNRGAFRFVFMPGRVVSMSMYFEWDEVSFDSCPRCHHEQLHMPDADTICSNCDFIYRSLRAEDAAQPAEQTPSGTGVVEANAMMSPRSPGASVEVPDKPEHFSRICIGAKPPVPTPDDVDQSQKPFIPQESKQSPVTLGHDRGRDDSGYGSRPIGSSSLPIPNRDRLEDIDSVLQQMQATIYETSEEHGSEAVPVEPRAMDALDSMRHQLTSSFDYTDRNVGFGFNTQIHPSQTDGQQAQNDYYEAGNYQAAIAAKMNQYAAAAPAFPAALPSMETSISDAGLPQSLLESVTTSTAPTNGKENNISGFWQTIGHDIEELKRDLADSDDENAGDDAPRQLIARSEHIEDMQNSRTRQGAGPSMFQYPPAPGHARPHTVWFGSDISFTEGRFQPPDVSANHDQSTASPDQHNPWDPTAIFNKWNAAFGDGTSPQGRPSNPHSMSPIATPFRSPQQWPESVATSVVSATSGPPVPTTLNVEDWFTFFGIDKDERASMGNIAQLNLKPQVLRTESQAFQDELYTPNQTYASAAPKSGIQPQEKLSRRNVLTERLQAANLTRSSSPSSGNRRERSPFRNGSVIAPSRSNFESKVVTAASLRQQQKEAADDAEYARHRVPLQRQSAKTISPKEALLDYD